MDTERVQTAEEFNDNLKHMNYICFRSDNGADDGWAWDPALTFTRRGNDIVVEAEGWTVNYLGLEKTLIAENKWNEFVDGLIEINMGTWAPTYDSEIRFLGGWSWDVTIRYDNQLPEWKCCGYLNSPDNFDELARLMKKYGYYRKNRECAVRSLRMLMELPPES